jgi:glutamate-1-semialdehyde aminotransferase
MSEIKENPGQLHKDQAAVALRRLQDALIEHVEDVNARLQAGLAVRETQTAIEVHEIEKSDAVLRLSLTRENNVNYTQLIKRHNEMQSGVIYIRASQDGSPILLFSDFPHPNEQVSYREASRRLLNSSF